jgi:hypothetical protein
LHDWRRKIIFYASRLRMQARRSPPIVEHTMKKLKLEELTVESFETAADGPRLRGTVDGHAKPTLFITCTCQPTDPNMDCTFGCSRDSGCPDTCIVVSEFCL